MTRLLSITPEQIESVRNRQKADEAFRGTFGPNRGLQAHYDRAALLRALDEAQARVERYESLIRAMIENEPDDAVSDGGHTVLDLWRHDARAALKETGQ